MIAIGTHAIAGIGRRTSETGHLVDELEAAHHEAERYGDKSCQREAEYDSAAAQQHVQQEFWIVDRFSEAGVDREGRGDVGEANEEHHAIFGQQIPEDQKGD